MVLFALKAGSTVVRSQNLGRVVGRGSGPRFAVVAQVEPQYLSGRSFVFLVRQH